MRDLIKPARLKEGDTVGIIAPASPPSAAKALEAEKLFIDLGLKVEFGESLSRDRYGYLAGTDEERAEEVHRMFADERIKAIFSTHGGYGTGRIASRLDYDLIRNHPKIFWGYSDLTFLHTSIHQETGLVTFHGPMLSSDLGGQPIDPLTVKALQSLFSGEIVQYPEGLGQIEVISDGKATGKLVGGNLSLLVSTLGTPYEIESKGNLLFIEDVEEEPYRIDRMLNQLKMAGKFREAAGILLCDFRDCEPDKYAKSLTLKQVFRDHLADAEVPVLSGFKIGHSPPRFSVPIGVQASMDTSEKRFSLQESGVKERI